MAANVCVSAVVPFRSRVLSHETIALNEDKTLNQLVTAPLQKHFVGGSWWCALNVYRGYNLVIRSLNR